MSSLDWIRLFISSRAGRAIEHQTSLLSGSNSPDYSIHDPTRLFIIQLGVIMLMTQLMSILLGRIGQPRVIAEVLGGIILGPTGMGRIPGFTEHIFPEQSRPFLSLVANIGLILFLFLVGLEIDVGVIKRNARTSVTISAGGMLLPFGIGCAVAIPIYNNFIDPDAASFGHFLLFVGVAFSITAFPVLCRILVALELLDTTVGIVVLSAGIGNDVVGWTLLALTVALVNASTGLSALYVLLYAMGWSLFILYPAKQAMAWLARWTGSAESGPSPLFMTTTVLLIFGSAFFTDIIGVHAIFGGFLAGLAIPHEGGLAIALTEKLEDMVSIIFLPLYFTLSGLSTDLRLLNDGTTWGYTILICVTAYIGKFVGGTLAAKLTGFTTRESATIGTLMSCKGLVELIVLNVGLSAGILSTRVFSMFVLEALVLTFATTPATLWLYPVKYRARANTVGGIFDRRNDSESSQNSDASDEILGLTGKRKFLFVFDRFESLPGAMMLSRLLQVVAPSLPETEPPKIDTRSSLGSSKISPASVTNEEPLTMPCGVTIDALRLFELTERTSAIMRSSEIGQIITRDPLLTVFRTFAEMEGIPVTSALSIISHESFSTSVVDHSTENGDEMIVVSWTPSTTQATTNAQSPAQTIHNPFDGLFRTNGGVEATSSGSHSQFFRQLFAKSSVDVALFMDCGSGGPSSGGVQHLFVPFFGGPDDRLALSFVIQLCKHPLVSATVVRIHKAESVGINTTAPELTCPTTAEQPEDIAAIKANNMSIPSTNGELPDTVYAAADTQTRIASDALDDIMWTRCSSELGSRNINFEMAEASD
ncbi:K(+)/H(+) antiporter 1 [Rhizoctonia solani AG-1 IB]|uniref:K(+)/H(+) antiporter 1 n=1 Tax=Thanatephorus cucumeris (strain AG1-IB / isolate 7/3/14) TaxID=1108050 RepID=M5CH61_THACB|nr:K(+)/H(+) antiporter 1 [Rhizoctonia solani AG-1 IB]